MTSAYSHTGHVRAANQDAYGYSVEAQCFAVCDGMGGNAGGEVASRITVETFLERFAVESPVTLSASAARRRIEQAVAAANRILYTRGQREPALQGMGTTLVALVFGEGRAWVAHVGDSRCYLLRDGRLVRCTEDHSLVEEQVRLGQMTPEAAAQSPLRHVITRAVGVRKAVHVEIHELAVEPGDLFLLCSDGLTRELADPRIAQLLEASASRASSFHEAAEEAEDETAEMTAEKTAEMTADEAANQDADKAAQQILDPAHQLVAEALTAGGADNVTCLTVRFG